MKEVINKRNFIKKFNFALFAVCIIFVSGIVLAENYQIRGHSAEEVSHFLKWLGNVGFLERNQTAKAGSHTSEEIQDIAWFLESDGKERGAVLKNGSFCSTRINLTFYNTNQGYALNYDTMSGIQRVNDKIEYFIVIYKTNSTGKFIAYFTLSESPNFSNLTTKFLSNTQNYNLTFTNKELNKDSCKMNAVLRGADFSHIYEASGIWAG